MHYDQEIYAILEIIGWDETNKVEYVLGERQMQVLDIINKQIIEDNRKKISAGVGSPTKPQVQSDSDGRAELAAMREFGQCSAKF